MNIIITTIIQILFDILLFSYHPKKSYYEYNHFDTVLYNYYTKNIDDFYQTFYFHNSLSVEKIFKELINTKKINQAVLAFAIILFIIFFILAFSKIIMKCKDNNLSENQTTFLIVLIGISFFFIFINWAMALAIVAKVNKLRKKDGDKFGLTNKIKSGIVKSCIIISFQLILIVIQLILIAVQSKNDNSNYSPRVYIQPYTYSHNTGTSTQVNNYIPSQRNPSTTRRIEVIHVRSQNTVTIRRIVPNEVYSQINKYKDAGKILFLNIVKFYEVQKFDGLTSVENITKEILDIIIKLCEITTDIGDETPAKIVGLYLLQRDEDYLFLLVLYLFPLIMMIIKIKIELGIYKKSYQIVTNNVIIVLEQLERNVESDIDGNLRETFRYRRQINRNILINLIRP